MHVAIDAQLLSYRQWYRSAGLSRYIDRMVRYLPSADSSSQFTVFTGAMPADDATPDPKIRWRQTRWATHRPIVRILWEQLVQPALLAKSNVDLLHGPAYVVPLASRVPSVVTIHDLSFILLPNAFNRQNRLYLTWLTRWSTRRANRVIAVSKNTRDDLVRLLGVAPEKIDVVHNGVDPHFRPIDDLARLAAFRAAKGLPEKFILFLGTLEPRKNIGALLRAYAAARRGGLDVPLLIAGGRGWRDSSVFELVQSLELNEAVRFTGFIPSSEQPWWYNAATVFAFPSLYEGFGFPPLEAMACGTAVVTSNRSSLPEVVGDAGLVVDPADVDGLALALGRCVSDAELRAELRRRSLERVQNFSWPRAAEETIGVFRRAIGPAQVQPCKRRSETA